MPQGSWKIAPGTIARAVAWVFALAGALMSTIAYGLSTGIEQRIAICDTTAGMGEQAQNMTVSNVCAQLAGKDNSLHAWIAVGILFLIVSALFLVANRRKEVA